MGMLFRRAAWWLFKVPSVALTDHDGEVTVAFARQNVNGGWWAYRWRSIGRKVQLLPMGYCSGPCYVHSWRTVVGALGSPR